MYEYRVLIEHQGSAYSIIIKSECVLAQRSEFVVAVIKEMKKRGIDVSDGLEIHNVDKI